MELAPFRSLSEFERLKQGCATGRPVPSESTLVIGFWGVMQSLPFRSLSECECLKPEVTEDVGAFEVCGLAHSQQLS